MDVSAKGLRVLVTASGAGIGRVIPRTFSIVIRLPKEKILFVVDFIPVGQGSAAA